MVAWWDALIQLERFFAYIAFASTLVLLIQLVLLLFGIGGGDVDADVDFDGDVDGGFDISDVDGLHIFSLRGIVSFFAVFGWTGILVSKNSGGNVLLSVTIAFIAGFLTMIAVAYLIKGLMRLQSDGSLDYKNALGLPATVYITVPPARSEKGKINTILQGRYTEIDAVTDEETPIRFGEEVVVIGLSGNNTLVVKRK